MKLPQPKILDQYKSQFLLRLNSSEGSCRRLGRLLPSTLSNSYDYIVNCIRYDVPKCPKCSIITQRKLSYIDSQIMNAQVHLPQTSLRISDTLLLSIINLTNAATLLSRNPPMTRLLNTITASLGPTSQIINNIA
jgi:hypothetical protein